MPGSRLPDPKDGLHMASASLPCPPGDTLPDPLGHVLTGCSVPGGQEAWQCPHRAGASPSLGFMLYSRRPARHQRAVRPHLSGWVREAEGEADVKHTDTQFSLPRVRARSLHPAAPGGRARGSTHEGTRLCPHLSLSSRGLGWCPRVLIVSEGTGPACCHPPASSRSWGGTLCLSPRLCPLVAGGAAPLRGPCKSPVTHHTQRSGPCHASTTTSRALASQNPLTDPLAQESGKSTANARN